MKNSVQICPKVVIRNGEPLDLREGVLVIRRPEGVRYKQNRSARFKLGIRDILALSGGQKCKRQSQRLTRT